MATLSAWCYPSDAEVRAAAAQACGLVNVDYIISLADVMEATNADAHTARQKVAFGFLVRIAACVDQGQTPRLGVLSTGQPANAWGTFTADEDADYV